MPYPKLNFPPVRLRAMHRDGADYVWDALRGTWLLLTPEEWVRRHVISYLTEGLNAQPVDIVQEFPVLLEGMAQRADIVIYGRSQKPVMLVECKAPGIRIDAAVLDQAIRYNSIVEARYLMLTNGLKHYFYATYDGVNYSPLDAAPDIHAVT